MQYFELTTIIKSELGLTDSQFDEPIKRYIDIGQAQIKRYTGSVGLTKVLLIIIKNFVIDKMQNNNYKFDEELVGKSGLDEFFTENYMNQLNSHRRLYYSFKNTSKTLKTVNKKHTKNRRMKL